TAARWAKTFECSEDCPFSGHRVPMRPVGVYRPRLPRNSAAIACPRRRGAPFRGHADADFHGLRPRDGPSRPERAGSVSAAGADLHRLLFPADPAAAEKIEGP